MERFEHLAMVAFLILGVALVRLMINLTSLLAKNTIHNKNEDGVKFYWVHSVFCFITFFTIVLFWWTCYPLNNLDYFPDDDVPYYRKTTWGDKITIESMKDFDGAVSANPGKMWDCEGIAELRNQFKKRVCISKADMLVGKGKI